MKELEESFETDDIVVVFSPRLVTRLTEKGYVFKKIKPNKLDPNSVVFYYIRTPELEKEINSFKTERKVYREERYGKGKKI